MAPFCKIHAYVYVYRKGLEGEILKGIRYYWAFIPVFYNFLPDIFHICVQPKKK